MDLVEHPRGKVYASKETTRREDIPWDRQELM